MEGYGGREGENKAVVRLRSGMKQGARVFIARLRREPIVVCSIFAGRDGQLSAKNAIAYVISLIPFGQSRFSAVVISTSFPLPPCTELSQYVRPRSLMATGTIGNRARVFRDISNHRCHRSMRSHDPSWSGSCSETITLKRVSTWRMLHIQLVFMSPRNRLFSLACQWFMRVAMISTFLQSRTETVTPNSSIRKQPVSSIGPR